jgi:ABC-type dipeptide/oligopeptide/nickel transport system ATPase component
MALLEVNDLKTWYHTDRGVVRAVDGVTFTLEEGRTLGVVGESGCGKSQLARSIMGLLQRRGVERHGSAKFEGLELVGLPTKALRKLYGPSISMIFQDPMTSLNPVHRIGKQLTEGLRIHFGVDKNAAMETAEELLRSVGIPEPKRRLTSYPFETSPLRPWM